MASSIQKLFVFHGSAGMDRGRDVLMAFIFLVVLPSVLMAAIQIHQHFKRNEAPARALYSYGAIQGAAGLADKTVMPVDAIEARKNKALVEFLARKYQVSRDAMLAMVLAAYDAADRVGIDPLLIIAVMGVESRFNPIAESVAGAKGLMQVIPRYHPDKLPPGDNDKAVLDPQTNILVGAMILKEYIDRSGSSAAGLQMYNGAPDDESNAYSNKVIGEQQRLRQLVRQLRV